MLCVVKFTTLPYDIVNLCNVPYVQIITHTLYFVNTKKLKIHEKSE